MKGRHRRGHRTYRRPALPGKLITDRVEDVDRRAAVLARPSLDEVVHERFPGLTALLAIMAENESDEREWVAADRRVYGRHRPVWNHGRFSADWADVCVGPCDHYERPLVCGWCHDLTGDVDAAPCDELADLCARWGIELEGLRGV